MIYEGLCLLIRRQPFASITVKELVEAAQVGRTTFYRNFDTIEDVLHMRCDQVFDGLLIYLQAYRQQQPSTSGVKLLKPVLRYFDTHSELIEILLLAHRVDMLEESFRRLLQPFKPLFTAAYAVELAYVDYLLAIRIGGMTNALTHWITTGKQQSPDELADRLSVMIQNIVTVDQLL